MHAKPGADAGQLDASASRVKNKVHSHIVQISQISYHTLCMSAETRIVPFCERLDREMSDKTRPASTVDPSGEFPLDLTTYVFHLFTVVARHRDARLEAALKPHNLNVSRHRALSSIDRLAPCSMRELAEFVAVDRTTLTRTVDQLAEAGLVERATPREDRRQVVLTMTSAGRAACRRALQAIYRVNRELLQDMSEAEQRVLARGLDRLVGRLAPDPALLRRLRLSDIRPAE
jgi:DNA-binding MarR family transcriptional regulator